MKVNRSWRRLLLATGLALVASTPLTGSPGRTQRSVGETSAAEPLLITCNVRAANGTFFTLAPPQVRMTSFPAPDPLLGAYAGGRAEVIVRMAGYVNLENSSFPAKVTAFPWIAPTVDFQGGPLIGGQPVQLGAVSVEPQQSQMVAFQITKKFEIDAPFSGQQVFLFQTTSGGGPLVNETYVAQMDVEIRNCHAYRP